MKRLFQSQGMRKAAAVCAGLPLLLVTVGALPASAETGEVDQLERDRDLVGAEGVVGGDHAGEGVAIAGGRGADVHAAPRRRPTASRAMVSMSAGKSRPAAAAARATPASGEMSQLGLTSITHGVPAASTRRSTRP